MSMSSNYRAVIVTQFRPCTNTKGSRYTARCDLLRVSIEHPAEWSDDECHAQAAAALCRKAGWHGELVCGQIVTNGHCEARVFCFRFFAGSPGSNGCLCDTIRIDANGGLQFV